MTLRIGIVSLNVAKPHVLCEKNGETIVSGIAKIPVTLPSVAVRETNIEGDAQADLENHGGPDKAVYAYPSDHWEWWEREHGFSCRPGRFGENLTVTGANETTVRIGDRFAWSGVVLEISQPRMPCEKLHLYSGRPDVGTQLTLSGRCGWYFRVVRTGTAPVHAASLERISQSDGPTVREMFHAAFDRRIDPQVRAKMASLPALSEAWRHRLLKRTS